MRRRSGGRSVMSVPARLICPACCGRSPAMVSSSMVLPAPDGPSTTSTRSAGTSRLTGPRVKDPARGSRRQPGMADLVVELYGTRPVYSPGHAHVRLLPHAAAVARFGIDSPVLSVAIPLAVVAVRSRKERRQNFFWELLPEGRMLTRLAQQADLAEQDVIGLLRAY